MVFIGTKCLKIVRNSNNYQCHFLSEEDRDIPRPIDWDRDSDQIVVTSLKKQEKWIFVPQKSTYTCCEINID